MNCSTGSNIIDAHNYLHTRIHLYLKELTLMQFFYDTPSPMNNVIELRDLIWLKSLASSFHSRASLKKA
jgi:hypothetical protein